MRERERATMMVDQCIGVFGLVDGGSVDGVFGLVGCYVWLCQWLRW